MACVLEATARKPGNVHPGSSFHDLSYGDFVRSAAVVAPVLGGSQDRAVGATVLAAITETRRAVGQNSNLGIVLLLAPLVRIPGDVSLEQGIGGVLDDLARDDAVAVYEAIRIANPGGLGSVDREDVSAEPSITLLEAMCLAADRDRVAQQYATRFSAVFRAADRLAGGARFPQRWEEAVIETHLWLMAECPDTLIARKCGLETARQSADRARAVLDAGWPNGPQSASMMADLDAWLRADGNRRNPGTTADLVAAALFAALRDRKIEAPPMPAAALPFLERN